MLVLKKEMSFYDFMDAFDYELKDLPREAIAIIFDSLCEMFYNGDHEAMDVSDYLRYQMRVLSLDEVIHDYGYITDLEGLEGEELIEAVQKRLEHKTYVLGTFEEDGKLYFIFDEF